MHFRQGAWRRLAYIPRFVRHYRHRRQVGRSFGDSRHGARDRMRSYRL